MLIPKADRQQLLDALSRTESTDCDVLAAAAENYLIDIEGKARAVPYGLYALGMILTLNLFTAPVAIACLLLGGACHQRLRRNRQVADNAIMVYLDDVCEPPPLICCYVQQRY